MDALELRNEIVGFLETVKDEDFEIDTGHYLPDDTSECFVTVGGVEYHVTVKEAKQQGRSDISEAAFFAQAALPRGNKRALRAPKRHVAPT